MNPQRLSCAVPSVVEDAFTASTTYPQEKCHARGICMITYNRKVMLLKNRIMTDDKGGKNNNCK